MSENEEKNEEQNPRSEGEVHQRENRNKFPEKQSSKSLKNQRK